MGYWMSSAMTRNRIEAAASPPYHLRSMNLATPTKSALPAHVPDALGHFGPYGGVYVPETLIFALEQLEREYARAMADPRFHAEFGEYLREFVGRPSRLYFAKRLTEKFGGAKIYLKREDLNHTGAHKINNTIGQAP